MNIRREKIIVEWLKSWRHFWQQRPCKCLIQFRTERQPNIFKEDFLRSRPIHFHLNSRSVSGSVKWERFNSGRVIRSVKWKKLSFQVIKLTSHFLQQSTVSTELDSSSKANSHWAKKNSNPVSTLASEKKCPNRAVKKVFFPFNVCS